MPDFLAENTSDDSLTLFTDTYPVTLSDHLPVGTYMIYTLDGPKVLTISDAGAHRYWRVYVEELNGGGYVGCREIEFRDAEGTSLMTGGGTVLFSTENMSFPAANVFDNDFNTWWYDFTPSPVEPWIGYDFGEGNAVAVGEVGIAPYGTGVSSRTSNFKTFRIEHSDDGTTWTTLWREDDIVFTGDAAALRTFTPPE